MTAALFIASIADDYATLPHAEYFRPYISSPPRSPRHFPLKNYARHDGMPFNNSAIVDGRRDITCCSFSFFSFLFDEIYVMTSPPPAPITCLSWALGADDALHDELGRAVADIYIGDTTIAAAIYRDGEKVMRVGSFRRHARRHERLTIVVDDATMAHVRRAAPRRARIQQQHLAASLPMTYLYYIFIFT